MAPNAWEITVADPVTKQDVTEIIPIPSVKDPKPKPASYLGLFACPKTAAFTIEYIGWKKLPITGLIVRLTTVYDASLNVRGLISFKLWPQGWSGSMI